MQSSITIKQLFMVIEDERLITHTRNHLAKIFSRHGVLTAEVADPDIAK